MNRTFGEKVFGVINAIVLFIVAAVCIYPLIYVASSSVSSVQAISSGKVILFPVEFTLAAYKSVFNENDIWLGFANSIFYMVVGTAFSMLLTMLGAYPLSKKNLKYKPIFMAIIAFTMWFNAGTVPSYLNYVDLGLLNSRLGVILNGGLVGAYLIILRSFFQSIPEALDEAARIDGAGHFRILFTIYMPLSKAAFATLALKYGILRWNEFWWPMILLSNAPDLQPLQLVLRRMLIDTTTSLTQGGEQITNYSVKMMTYAVIMVSIIPMLAIYPFAQKYFTKGLMIGSIKG